MKIIRHILAALAASMLCSPAIAGPIKLTVNTWVSDDEDYLDGYVFDFSIYATGDFQFAFNPATSIAPTTSGLLYASLTGTYVTGNFTYLGGSTDAVYDDRPIITPTLYSYDAANRAFFIGSNFAGSAPGAPCTLTAVLNSHCLALFDFDPANGSFLSNTWKINGGPFDIFGGTSISVEAVPEPSAWALMLLGFAAIGAVLRRRPSAIPA